MTQKSGFTYHGTFQAFGRPLDLSDLLALKVITGWSLSPPSRQQVFVHWASLAQRNKHHCQGQSALCLEADDAVTVHRLLGSARLGNEQRPVQHVAHISADGRRWSRSVRFDAGSSGTGPQYAEDGSWRSAHLRLGRQEHVLTRPLVHEWRLLTDMQHQSGCIGELVAAEWWNVLEGCAVLKPETRFLDCGCQLFNDTHGQLYHARVVQQYGRGSLPQHYCFNESGRLLAVIGQNTCLIDREITAPKWLPPEHLSLAMPQLPTQVDTSASPKSRSQRPRGRSRRPSIVLLTVDQLHHQALAARGATGVSTPHMDRLCAQGTAFSNAYCTNPICTPARASWYSGEMPSAIGVHGLGDEPTPGSMRLGRMLREEAGYQTHYIGKWHVTNCHSYDVPGFDVHACGQDHRGDISDAVCRDASLRVVQELPDDEPWFMAINLLQPHDICQWCRLHLQSGPLPLEAVRATLPPEPDRRHCSEECEALRAMRQAQEPQQGHWQTDDWRWYRWSYDRMVEMVDAEIGRIVDALNDRFEDVLLLFTSDHGEALGGHGFVRKNNLYEDAVRVPLVLRWPGQVPAGQISQALCSGVDLLPTICQAAGLAVPAACRGRNLLTLCDVQQPDSQTIVVEQGKHGQGRAVRHGAFKYIRYVDDPVEMLFDLEQDPGELQNLLASPRARHQQALQHLRHCYTTAVHGSCLS